jgi:hypothetical protein
LINDLLKRYNKKIEDTYQINCVEEEERNNNAMKAERERENHLAAKVLPSSTLNMMESSECYVQH